MRFILSFRTENSVPLSKASHLASVPLCGVFITINNRRKFRTDQKCPSEWGVPLSECPTYRGFTVYSTNIKHFDIIFFLYKWYFGNSTSQWGTLPCRFAVWPLGGGIPSRSNCQHDQKHFVPLCRVSLIGSLPTSENCTISAASLCESWFDT